MPTLKPGPADRMPRKKNRLAFEGGDGAALGGGGKGETTILRAQTRFPSSPFAPRPLPLPPLGRHVCVALHRQWFVGTDPCSFTAPFRPSHHARETAVASKLYGFVDA